MEAFGDNYPQKQFNQRLKDLSKLRVTLAVVLLGKIINFSTELLCRPCQEMRKMSMKLCKNVTPGK